MAPQAQACTRRNIQLDLLRAITQPGVHVTAKQLLCSNGGMKAWSSAQQRQRQHKQHVTERHARRQLTGAHSH